MVSRSSFLILAPRIKTFTHIDLSRHHIRGNLEVYSRAGNGLSSLFFFNLISDLITEQATYLDPAGIARVYDILEAVSKRTSLHMVFGAVGDYVSVFCPSLQEVVLIAVNSSSEMTEDVFTNALGGTQNLAGGKVRWIEGKGHLVSY